MDGWRGPFRHFAVVYLAWPHATLVGKVFSDFQISVFGHKFMRHQFSLWTEAAEGTAKGEEVRAGWGVRWNPLNPKLVIANQQASAHSFCMNCRQRLTLKCSRPLFKVPKNQKPNPENFVAQIKHSDSSGSQLGSLSLFLALGKLGRIINASLHSIAAGERGRGGAEAVCHLPAESIYIWPGEFDLTQHSRALLLSLLTHRVPFANLWAGEIYFGSASYKCLPAMLIWVELAGIYAAVSPCQSY